MILSHKAHSAVELEPMQRMQQMQRISLTLHPEDLEFFERMATTMDVSKSRLIRQAMREFREKYEMRGGPEAALEIFRKG